MAGGRRPGPARRTDIDAQIERAMRLPYVRIIEADEDGYSARVLEFPGCFSSGESAAEAAIELEDAMRVWMESELEAGHVIPEPIDAGSYSGKLTLRLTPSLHRELATRAAVEQRSLNGLMAELLAIGIGAPLRAPADRGAAGERGLYRVAESAED
ncbi:MAG: toxin-antitoxin system HicB family antitoxin [Dehalococcoidia bacterium]